jgi:hypothetical protein
MALQKQIIVAVRNSDLSGRPDAETHRFAIDGEVYRLDLTADEFDAVVNGNMTEDGKAYTLGDLIEKAEELGQTRETTPASDGSAKREWAKSVAHLHGWTIGDKGRMPAAVDAEYARRQSASDTNGSEAVTEGKARKNK